MSNIYAVTTVFGYRLFRQLDIPWHWMRFNETQPIHGMSAGDATEAIVG
jgi:hypothetical protein